MEAFAGEEDRGQSTQALLPLGVQPARQRAAGQCASPQRIGNRRRFEARSQ
jgi:hypothetical protein